MAHVRNQFAETLANLAPSANVSKKSEIKQAIKAASKLAKLQIASAQDQAEAALASHQATESLSARIKDAAESARAEVAAMTDEAIRQVRGK